MRMRPHTYMGQACLQRTLVELSRSEVCALSTSAIPADCVFVPAKAGAATSLSDLVTAVTDVVGEALGH